MKSTYWDCTNKRVTNIEVIAVVNPNVYTKHTQYLGSHDKNIFYQIDINAIGIWRVKTLKK